MPNGFHGSSEAWERMEAPLRVLDPVLEDCAARHGMSLSRNSRNWPERGLAWGAPIERLIQIYLEDEDRLTWNVWICAFEDRPSGRHWKREFLRSGEPIARIRTDLEGLLGEAVRIVEGWSGQDLEPAIAP